MMPTGKGRRPAPKGYMTPAKAAELLGSRSNVYKLVLAGRLHKHIPPGKTHGYYPINEVEAIIEAEKAFFEAYQPGDYRKRPSSSFERATIDDMPAIQALRQQTFNVAPASNQTLWLKKNPDVFYVLRDQTRKLVGYSCVLPMSEARIDQFCRGLVTINEITDDDVEVYAPGQCYQVYIVALVISPDCTATEKHTYGARLVSGLFAAFYELASRGVEIETITARSYKPDGLRLLRRLGFPQLRSTVPGMNLFSIRVADSGMPFLVKYSELLDQWKREHPTNDKPKRTRKQQRPPNDPPATPDLWGNLS